MNDESEKPKCECNETIAKTGEICKACREQNIRDYNFIVNAIEMDKGEYE